MLPHPTDIWLGRVICFSQEMCHFEAEAVSPSMYFTRLFFFSPLFQKQSCPRYRLPYQPDPGAKIPRGHATAELGWDCNVSNRQISIALSPWNPGLFVTAT